MVHCTETEPSDSNEADRGSELSDNDESQRREVTQPPTATKNHLNTGMLSCWLTLLWLNMCWSLSVEPLTWLKVLAADGADFGFILA